MTEKTNKANTNKPSLLSFGEKSHSFPSGVLVLNFHPSTQHNSTQHNITRTHAQRQAGRQAGTLNM